MTRLESFGKKRNASQATKIVTRVTPSQLNGDQMGNASLATIVFQHVTSCGLLHIWLQTRNQGPKPPRNFFAPLLEKCVGHSLKLLDTVQKIWAPQKQLCPSWCPKVVTGLYGCHIL